MKLYRAAALGLATILSAGCAGGAHQNVLPTAGASQPSLASKGSAVLSIRIPKAATTTTSSKRKPDYISPSTTQMTLDIQQSGASIPGYPTTVSLTPTSTGCSSTLTSTLCQLSIALTPGSYTASLTMMNASSTVLSAAQSVAFTITQGTANAINVTLNGVPSSIVISPGGYAVHGTQNEGMILYGASSQHFIANALDADGNVIIGPGAPSFTVSVGAGSGWSASAPASTTPNTFTVTPPGTNNAFATVSVTATYSDSTCATSGAVCAATVGIKNDIQTLYILNYGTAAVTGYNLPMSNGASPTIAAFNGGHFGAGWALALDPFNNVFVADPTVGGRGSGTNAVYEYSPSGSYITSIPSSSGINAPWGMAFDRLGDLFVANLSGNNVTEYPPPYTTTTPVTLSKNQSGATNTSGEGAVAFDSSGNLFVESDSFLYKYAPPFSSSSNATLQQVVGDFGTPIVFDQLGDLYLMDESNNVKKLAPSQNYSYFSAATTFAGGSPGRSPQAIAVDASGNVFISICGVCGGSSGDSINEYSASGTLLASISSGVSDPYAIALDGAGNLYVANCLKCVGSSGDSIVVFGPPFTNNSAPMATLNDASINGPTSFAITP